MDQDATWYRGRPWPRRHCVRWGPSSSLPTKGAPPQFLAHVHCGQTAGWIKMALGMWCALVHATLCSPKGGKAAPNFGPFLLWRNGWMHQDATWYGGRPQPRRLCVRWGPSPPPQKGVKPPNFPSTYIVAKRLHGSRCRLVGR